MKKKAFKGRKTQRVKVTQTRPRKERKGNTVNPGYNHLTWNLKIVAVVGSLPLLTGHLYSKTPMVVVVDRRLL